MFDVTKAAIDYLMKDFESQGIDPKNTYVRLYMSAG